MVFVTIASVQGLAVYGIYWVFGFQTFSVRLWPVARVGIEVKGHATEILRP